MRQVFTILLLLTFFGKPSFSQVTYLARLIDNNDGLSNSCINTVFQDSDDLMWFGTWDGLNLYNGTSMHVFNYGKEIARNYLSSNIILNINEDQNRNIWVGTVEGVSKIDKQTGKLTNYFYDNQKASSTGFVLTIDKKGKIFAAHRNTSSISYYNPSTDTFVDCNVKGISGMIADIKVDHSGNLWVLKNPQSLELYRPSANGFQKSANLPAVKDIVKLFYVNQQIYYTTSDGSLNRINNLLAPEKLIKLPHEVRSITYYQNHYIFAWSSKGIGEYTTDFKPDPFISKDLTSLAGKRITSLYSGKEDILWLGFDGSGVIKITKKPSYFGAVLKQNNGQPFSIPVRAFCMVTDELWVGTKGNGIITIKDWGKPDMKFSGIRSFAAGEDLLDNCVYSIEKGKDGFVYIGSDAPGITLYDQNAKKFIYWKDVKGSKSYPFFNSVHCILYDRDSSVWLGLNASGLVHLKVERDVNQKPYIKYLKNYTYDGSNRGIANNVIYSLAAGSNNTIWIGCRYGGLTLLDKTTGKFKTIRAFSYQGSLSNNDILSLYTDQKKRLWVGTSYGLNWTDESSAIKLKRPVFRKLNTDNGLLNNSIHAIIEDTDKNIWISTNKGIAKIDPVKLKIVNFKQADGLQSDEFSDNAVWKAENGEIFFGGIYGFNYFQPQNVRVNTNQPRLMLSNLQLAGKKVNTNIIKVLSSGTTPAPLHYELAPQDNYFEQKVEFISFINPNKCQYSYLLENNDKNWHQATHEQTIFYNNLAPGNYTLKLKWSNGEGGWTKPVIAYTLTVKPYFWLTPFAFAFYFVVLSASAFLYYRYRRNKFLLIQKFAVEHMLREKDEKLHQEKLNLFTNIAHELQTPLTLILGALERYLYKNKQPDHKEQGGQFLSIVKHEAARLHYLVHQLLEFRKAESGQLQNHYSYLHVSNLFNRISGLFNAIVDQKELDFSIYIEPDVSLWMDKDKLEKIVFNLLSNAFKHTAEKQYVMFSVQQLKTKEHLEIIVANSGCNLSEAEIVGLFNMYFAVDDSQQTKISTGIGLAFTRQLVQSLKGEISVKQENGWISFKVLLPLTFVPEQNSRLTEQPDHYENPSYIFSSLTNSHDKWMQPLTAESNKKALVKSFEQEEKKTILIVEDEKLIRYLLKDILSEQYITYEASTGKEALAVIGRVVPDLIISDIMMPDMDGLEFCKVIKDTPASCHIPFVMLTARNTIEQETEGYGSGADAYLSKPFQTEHLLVRLHKLLEYRDKLHQYFRSESPLSKVSTLNEVSDSDKNFIEKVVSVIEENIEKDLDSAFLENALNVSRIQLYRKIKTLADMTPTELIRHIRLKRTVHLLETTDLTVSEIFYRTGFNNKTYFFREFKKNYNCSPNDYRLNYRLPANKKS